MKKPRYTEEQIIAALKESDHLSFSESLLHVQSPWSGWDVTLNRGATQMRENVVRFRAMIARCTPQ
jgi:hypothetical protein